MYLNMYARLEAIAESDGEREESLGCACPSKLDLWLSGGHELRDVCLVDGENSLDHETIDVRLLSGAAPSNETWTVAIAHIALLKHTWPSEALQQEACRRKQAAA